MLNGMGMGESYRFALQLAQDHLRQLSPAALQRRCQECGAELFLAAVPPADGHGPVPAGTPAGTVRVAFLGQPHTIALPAAEVRGPAEAEVPLWLKIILLHYVNGPETIGPAVSEGRRVSRAGSRGAGHEAGPGGAGREGAGAGGDGAEEELIPFRDLTGGRVYLPNFQKRVLNRLVKEFGEAPEKLVQAGSLLGGEKVSFGDAGVRLRPLPRVPLTFVVWAADDEFPAQANVLFHASVEDYLCTEDAIVLSEQVTSMLVGTARRLGEVA